MTAPLKPCPFCGSTEVAPFYSSWEYYRVECAKCSAAGPHADGAEVLLGDQEAAEALACERWNRRVEGGDQ